MVSVLVGVATLIVAAWTLKVSRDQRKIAREQAEQHPDLEVSQIDVVGASNDMRTKIRLIDSRRQEKERTEKGELPPYTQLD